MRAALAVLRWLLRSPARAIATLAGLAVVGLLVRAELLERKLHRAEDRIQALVVDSLNLEARMDTTRLLFRDSLTGYARMVEQLQVVAHPRLDRSGRGLSARADLTLRIVTLEDVAGEASAVREDTAGIRTAELALDSIPFHVRADVALPPPPAPASVVWRQLAIDAIAATLELACEGPAATAAAVTPPWVTLRFDQVQQTADVCNPPRAPSRRRRWVGWAVLEGATIGGVGGGIATGDTQGAAIGAAVGVAVELVLRAVGLH